MDFVGICMKIVMETDIKVSIIPECLKNQFYKEQKYVFKTIK